MDLENKTTETFHLFPKLPFELREQIWLFSIFPRILDFYHVPSEKPRYEVNGRYPALLWTCSESRRVGLKHYIQASVTTQWNLWYNHQSVQSVTINYWINLPVDFIALPHQLVFEMGGDRVSTLHSAQYRNVLVPGNQLHDFLVFLRMNNFAYSEGLLPPSQQVPNIYVLDYVWLGSDKMYVEDGFLDALEETDNQDHYYGRSFEQLLEEFPDESANIKFLIPLVDVEGTDAYGFEKIYDAKEGE